MSKEISPLPAGFSATGLVCGIKASGRPDLALLFSDRVCSAAAVETTNRLKGASLDITRRHLRGGRARAVIVVSGVANDCTGERGERDALEMARSSACHLGLKPEDVLVAATGVIGVFLPMEKVTKGIETAAGRLSNSGGSDAAQAIMTTDTRPKTAEAKIRIGKRDIRLWGMAKGSGMIHPQLATMLGFILTDVAVNPKVLKQALKASVKNTFNRISVDGDTSPSDTVMVLANGAAGNPEITDLDSASGKAFLKGLEEVSASLAEQIVRDGEGASRFVRIHVTGAADEAEADRIARGIATSSLVKTAIAGGDPNWGRIISALGQNARKTDPNSADLFLGDLRVFHKGMPTDFDKKEAEKIMARPEIDLHIRLSDGKGRVTFLTCDLTYEYVRINAEYHT